jgi:hypothetical protein
MQKELDQLGPWKKVYKQLLTSTVNLFAWEREAVFHRFNSWNMNNFLPPWKLNWKTTYKIKFGYHLRFFSKVFDAPLRNTLIKQCENSDKEGKDIVLFEIGIDLRRFLPHFYRVIIDLRRFLPHFYRVIIQKWNFLQIWVFDWDKY